MKAQQIIRQPVMTAKDRKFERLLRQAAELLNRRNPNFGPGPNVASATERFASK
jgi:hypothetical protein